MTKIKHPLAIVFPGGGFRGAYQAGVVYELGKLGIKADIVATASVGTCNGAAFTLGMWEILPELWEKSVDLKIFQPIQIFKGKNPFAISSVLTKFAKQYGRPGQFNESTIDFLVSVTNATTMKNEIIDFKDTNWNFEELEALYLASSSIPYICEKVFVRNNWYLDGGLTNNCPIACAVQKGAKEVWIVSMGKYAFLERNFFQFVRKSIKIWPGRKQQFIRFLEQLVTEQKRPDVPGVCIREIAPSSPLPLGHLRLTRENMRQAIQLGQKDIQVFLQNL